MADKATKRNSNLPKEQKERLSLNRKRKNRSPVVKDQPTQAVKNKAGNKSEV